MSVPDYKLIISKPKKMGRVRVGWRKDALTGESYFCMLSEARCADGKLVRGVHMTRDLPDLVVWMVNSYILPTDVKNMQRCHVRVIDSKRTVDCRQPVSLQPVSTYSHVGKGWGISV